MPKITIISPYHNRAQAVRLTLASVARQSFDDFEALIWDDGSTDETWDMLQSVQVELGDNRIKVYRHQPNIGLTAGLNDAIARAEGEYIAVLGSGDECAPDRLAKQAAALDADPEARFCACRSVTVDEVSGKRFSDEHFSGEIIRTADISEVCPFTHGSVMYRKSALEAVGGYDSIFKWCADWDVFFRLLDGGHAVYLPEDLYIRYARMDGVSFAPKKSVEQIKSKHLVLALAQLGDESREALKQKVRDQGLTQALRPRHPEITGDLRARQVKLILMGRTEPAAELGRLIDAEFGQTPKWRVMLGGARALAALPVDSDRLIAMARKLKSGLTPSRSGA
ncbi:MAG: glycosyltransferase [Methylocystaceae bacterium]|nr:glycosyltransferase [Methylocystaceae bacterium]